MNTKQLIIEPTLSRKQQDVGSLSRLVNQDQDNRERTLRLSLLRLHFNQRLTEADHAALGQLSPTGCSCFIVKDGRFLHPGYPDPFPCTLIECSCAPGDETVFTHRFVIDDYIGNSQSYKIFSGTVSSLISSETIICGFFGPEDSIDTAVATGEASQFMASWRKAFKQSSELVPRIMARIDAKNPTILLERVTGSILFFNDRARTLFGAAIEKLLDGSFISLQVCLSPYLSSHKLSLDNVTVEGLELTVLSLVQKPNQAVHDADWHSSLNQQIMSGAENIKLAVKHLEGISAPPHQDDSRFLTEIITKESEGIASAALKIELIENWDQLPTVEQNLIEPLKKLLAENCSNMPGLFQEESENIFHLAAPQNAVRLLFEEILMCHQRFNRGGKVEVFWDSDTSNQQVEIQIISNAAGTLAQELDFPEPTFLLKLAQLLGASVTSFYTDNRTKYQTKMTFKLNDKNE